MYTSVARVVLVSGLLFFAGSAQAADIEVRMLDSSATEGMLAFEPGFVKADVGDTIIFVPSNPGHNSSSLLVPAGAQSWKSPFEKEFRVKLEKEGVYLYNCDAHKNMGMVGVVQVGKAVNLDKARKKAAEESANMRMNKDRFAKALGKVQ